MLRSYPVSFETIHVVFIMAEVLRNVKQHEEMLLVNVSLRDGRVLPRNSQKGLQVRPMDTPHAVSRTEHGMLTVEPRDALHTAPEEAQHKGAL